MISVSYTHLYADFLINNLNYFLGRDIAFLQIALPVAISFFTFVQKMCIRDSLETARKLIEDARALDKAGVFAMVLECVPSALAQKITAEVSVPTIGIGAGPHCDGQVLVINDMLGISSGHIPKFVKKYADLQPVIVEALKAYKEEVEDGSFPGPEHCFTIADNVLDKLY